MGPLPLADAFDAEAFRADAAPFDPTRIDVLVLALPRTPQTDGLVTPGLTLASDVVDALDVALTTIRAGARPASAVTREQGY
ncbi:hypothetical protein [Promicromonospora sukumoe]|uniref:hypothetical protein n=1 Tax=Promicromonospora sukumoe TaxID=88382 RepID=UPI003655A6C5